MANRRADWAAASIAAAWYLWSAPVRADARFPPPEFESGYIPPIEQLPDSIGAAGQVLDVLLLLGALGLAAYLAHHRRSRRGLLALTGASLLYFGFVRHGCVCAVGSLQNIAMAMGDSSYTLPAVVLAFFALPLLATLLYGRIFCSSVCPLGAIQELALVRPLRVPEGLDRGLRVLPYLYLGAAVLLASTGSAFLICRYDPFVAFFRRSGSPDMLVLGAAFMLLGTVVGRPYCRWLCPYGVLLGIFSWTSRRRVTITPERCVSCHLCMGACPYGAIHEPEPALDSTSAQSSNTAVGSRVAAAVVLVLLPLLVVGGGMAGDRLAPILARLDSTVRLAEEVAAHERGEPADEERLEGFVRRTQSRKQLFAKSAEIRADLTIASVWAGALIGLALGLLLLSRIRRRRLKDYSTDPVHCHACARCYSACPVTDEGGLLEAPPLPQARIPLRRLGAAITTLALLFCATVSGLMIHYHSPASDLVDHSQVDVLKENLNNTGEYQPAVEVLRSTDRELREDHFLSRAVSVRGAWLLLVGVVVFVLAARVGRPRAGVILNETEEARGRRLKLLRMGGFAGVAAAIGLVIAVVWGAVLHVEGRVPADEDQLRSGETTSLPWPRFRGPMGAGVAWDSGPYSQSWDGGTGAGVAWRVPISLPGNGSPIVAGDRVFITGATRDELAVFAFHADTGELAWQRQVRIPSRKSQEEVFTNEDTGYAAPTMTAWNDTVVAVFYNGDVAAFSLDGEPRWSRNLGAPDTAYGYASSPIAYDGMLFIQVDQVKDRPSMLGALDIRSGETIWSVQRPVSNSWTTPVVIEVRGEEQLITAANPWVIAYAPKDGRELWRKRLLGGDVAPSPIYSGGLLFVVEAQRQLIALRPGGDGVEAEIVWRHEGGIPDVPTPVSDGERLFLLSSTGKLTCLRVADGQLLWESRSRGLYRASPGIAGGAVYITGDRGKTTLYSAADELHEIGRASLGERCVASPAFVDGRVYLRGAEHLFCLAAEEAEP